MLERSQILRNTVSTMNEQINLHIIKSITFGNESEIYTTETFEELQERLLRDHNNEIVKA